jgi:hypothetical protein
VNFVGWAGTVLAAAGSDGLAAAAANRLAVGVRFGGVIGGVPSS